MGRRWWWKLSNRLLPDAYRTFPNCLTDTKSGYTSQK